MYAVSCMDRAFVTGWFVSRVITELLNSVVGREVRYMTAFEIITIFIGILGLLFAFGSLIIAILNFLSKRNNRK